MEIRVRAVRGDEWKQVKELRLAALRDPAAPVAFVETYEQALAQPDSFWQDRTTGASAGTAVRQFVAEAGDGVWAGTLVVLVEKAGEASVFGDEVSQGGAQLVAVYVRPEWRGRGVLGELIDAGSRWAWSVDGVERVRLFVHEENGRARAAYEKCGFSLTGVSVPVAGDGDEPVPGARELEMVAGRQGDAG
ncbi:GNAT family N-acetyltransferase [Streptomyces triticagri]|uniref:GNAT family N-acetyltransferase n=1 Tax=Streptomyces triticagri TaxID=2293568 RepID=A0A372LXP2_9ACTN|nr:GNAT family protein [Streptomyces triticagri]RFU83043.1 GNAT family N-acetyltransferase [Streptomyces triticagri]